MLRYGVPYLHRGYPALPPGRPRWQCPVSAHLDLLYLSWGQRFYGRNPLPLSLSPGWPYILILAGSPTLLLAGRRVELRAGNLIILDTECACGWTDRADGRFQLLGSVWRTPPRTPRFVPPRGDLLQFHVRKETFPRFEEIHSNCRREVCRLDEFTAIALEELRLSWEVALGRALLSSSSALDSAAQFELAIRWLDAHPQEEKPVALLCEYLQTTISSLHRLFRRHLRDTVRNYHQRVKIVKACQKLREGQTSIKSLAYSLGYKHANDFSRAFKNFTNQSPTQFISQLKKED